MSFQSWKVPPSEPVERLSALTTEYSKDRTLRILSLDGGGSKGFYTLGVLSEIEAKLKCPLYKRFDIIFGTSTGSIIAALLALGHEVADIHALYKEHVPTVMKPRFPGAKSRALARLAVEIFGDRQFIDVKTGIGVVATKWVSERPMIFKANPAQAHGRLATFVPGFGVPIADAVQASCSAVPFFKRKTVVTSVGEHIDLIDGGFCANNPTLYAIADAVHAMKHPREDIRVLSLGVGGFPSTEGNLLQRILRRLPSVRLLEKTLGVNVESMEQLRAILFKDIKTVRVHDTFTKPELTTSFIEHNLRKLDLLWQEGRQSFLKYEQDIDALLA